MPVWVARKVPKWTVRGAPVCHDGDPVSVACHRMPPPAQRPATCLWESHGVTRGRVSWRAGPRWWLAAAAVLPRLRACRSSGLAGARGAPRRASLGVPWLAFPASSSRRGLGASAWSSRQAHLAGVFSPWPGKLLLPGPRLLGPASSSCRGLVFLAQILGPRSARGGAVEVLGVPLASLAAGRYYCPCTSSGY